MVQYIVCTIYFALHSLAYLVQYCFVLILKNLLQVNEVTTEGRSALLYAASKGREEIVRFLMAKVMLASDWSNDFTWWWMVGGGYLAITITSLSLRHFQRIQAEWNDLHDSQSSLPGEVCCLESGLLSCLLRLFICLCQSWFKLSSQARYVFISYGRFGRSPGPPHNYLHLMNTSEKTRLNHPCVANVFRGIESNNKEFLLC